jgi:hypothetical protein
MASGSVTAPMSSEGTTESRSHRRWAEAREIIAVFLLSATAILTAWCGFEASKWSGQMSIEFSQASGARIRSSDLASEARDAQAVDLALFMQWVDANATGDAPLAEYYRVRFTPELAVAFADWQAGGESVKSPFAEPSYMPEGTAESAEQATKADAKFEAALESNQRGDNYSLLTVLFALVLFFTAMSQRDTSRWGGWFLLGLGTVVAIAGGVILATFPVLV